jgi:hypothetical protein
LVNVSMTDAAVSESITTDTTVNESNATDAAVDQLSWI